MKKCSLSIGIVALNEADNIKKMLSSVLSQKQLKYTLDRIVVISDGSIDNTVEEVRSLKSSVIDLKVFKDRKGKSFHLNTLFKHIESDIVVLFDADVILADDMTIEHLIEPLISNEKIMYVGGNPQPTPGKTLIEKAVNVTFIPYDRIRTTLNGGSNPYGCDGRILALKKEFYKNVKVPADMIANDNYMYFCCITNGHEFLHVRDAVVYFRSPTNIGDQIRQNKRFVAAHLRMKKIFGPIVPRSYYIPPLLKYKYFALQVIRHPFLSIVIFFINLYCKLKARIEESRMDARWEIAETTKQDIKLS